MGTRNFLYEPAMSENECEQALTSGIKIAQRAMADECNVFGFGEMGIGNTSSASCLMSVLCGESLRACVGRGTGLDEIGLANKIDVLQRALDHHQPMKTNPIAVLATFGGFEIAMMTGAMLGAAQGGAVLLIDGFIATSALLVAAKIQPNILQYCVFSHCSDELGHKLMLEHLQAKPLLNLGLRLGEGTGAALAYPIVQAAVNFLNDMASFQSAGISNKSEI
jgi:nicotinate-nucleotide--dimethylbenzimidazole phosphoribosyltransferase